MGRGKIEREINREEKKKIFAWKERKKEESYSEDCCKRDKRKSNQEGAT